MKAKKHDILKSITKTVDGNQPTKDVEVLGITYTLKVYKPEAEDWVSANTGGSTLSSALINVKRPTVAAALNAINGVAIEEIFQLGDEIPASMREELIQRPKALREWRRDQILEFLREETDGYIVDKLYESYLEMLTVHRQTLGKIGNFSKETPTQT